MRHLKLHLFVWALLPILSALVAQETASPDADAGMSEFQAAFQKGHWAEALKVAEDDEARLLVHWRVGDLESIDALVLKSPDALPGDRIRLTLLREGPRAALALSTKITAQLKTPHDLLAVETLNAALWNGDVKVCATAFESVPDVKTMSNRSLERFCQILPRVSWLLGKPELARLSAVDMSELGHKKYAWNPRYVLLRTLYYFRAGQRIDALDWTKELAATSAQDPLMMMLPSEAKLNVADFDSVASNVELLMFQLERQIMGIETFTGVKRLEKIDPLLDKLVLLAPGHPLTRSGQAALAFAKGGAASYPDALDTQTAACGLYWHYLAAISGDAFDRAAALPWGRKACQDEPWNVDMHVAHAINCHREGLPEEALKHLDLAHAREPRLSQVWNLRTLIRSVMKDFIFHKEDTFDIRMRRDEWEPFKTLLLPRIKEEWQLLSKRYGEAPNKIHFIFYTDKQDFDVSVFMVPSAPAIGACMGRLVTMPSPSYLQYKMEPWAPVLRHEMAHAFHIHASGGRVTRWFTEGLAHYEEVVRHQKWDWEEGYDQKLVDKLAANSLAEMGDLDKGFNGKDARFYYQYCRWIMQWIDESYGWDKITACLTAYKDGCPDALLFDKVLGLSNAEAESKFQAWLRKNVVKQIPYPPRQAGPLETVPALASAFQTGRYFSIVEATDKSDDPKFLLWRAMALENLDGAEAALKVYTAIGDRLTGDYLFHFNYGRNLAEAGDWQNAIQHLEQAVTIYPSRVRTTDNPWYWLYQSYKSSKQPDKAAETIWLYTRVQQKEHRARFWLMRHCLEKGDWARVRLLIEELTEIHPFHFEVILWRAEQARREQKPELEKQCYAQLFSIARLDELVDQETLWSDQERLEFLKKGINPWLALTRGDERREAARIIEQFFPKHKDVRKALVEP